MGGNPGIKTRTLVGCFHFSSVWFIIVKLLRIKTIWVTGQQKFEKRRAKKRQLFGVDSSGANLM